MDAFPSVRHGDLNRTREIKRTNSECDRNPDSDRNSKSSSLSSRLSHSGVRDRDREGDSYRESKKTHKSDRAPKRRNGSSIVGFRGAQLNLPGWLIGSWLNGARGSLWDLHRLRCPVSRSILIQSLDPLYGNMSQSWDGTGAVRYKRVRYRFVISLLTSFVLL